ncbi:MAG: tyrosine-type recombinase/integrase, partial [Thermodesulfobacteriota bacterium]
MSKPFKRKIKNKIGKVTSIKWYIRYKINGKYKWEPIGDVGVVTKTFAQNVLNKRLRQTSLGQYDEILNEVPTLSEFKDRYIKIKREIDKNRSWKRNGEHLVHLCNFFGDLKLSEITSGYVTSYMEKRLKDKNKHGKSISPTTINRELATLKNLFNVAKNQDRFFGNNPVSKVNFFPEKNEKDRILLPKEETLLFENLQEHIKPIVRTALETGMRKMEILSLSWENVDLEN